MSATPSSMLALGTTAPRFELFDTLSQENVYFDALKGKNGTLIMFICNHCPYVKHLDTEIVKMAEEFILKGVSFIAISSNDVEKYPEDHPDLMRETGRKLKYPFPYLYDETQETAKAFQAACTPDFFLFDSNSKLVYRGQFDDSRPGNDFPVTGKDLRNAIACLLDNKPPIKNQKPSLGCGIKWKTPPL